MSYLVGGRDADWAMEFMLDCAARIEGRVQVTTDGHKAYLEAVETAFGADIDYAMLRKIYGAPTDAEQRCYSPAKCIGADMKVVSGDPDPKHVSTSYVERHKPNDADGDAPLHSLNEWLLQEIRESCGDGCDSLCLS